MRLEFDRGLVAEGGVLAVSVVVPVDEVENFGPGIGGVLKDGALEHLELEGADEGLGPRIVVRIGARGHALAQAGGGQELAKGGAGVLAAAVAMEDSLVDRPR